MNYRLSSHIRPTQYTIMLHPDLEAFTFYGEETIRLLVDTSTKKITLHAAELEIHSVKLTEKGSKKSLNATIVFDKEREEVTFVFEQEITPGEKDLMLTFNGILKDTMRGFYRSAYEVDGKQMYMAVTQLESTDARRVFPSFDEPSYKAIFNVSVKVPPDHIAISNTIEEEIVKQPDGYNIVKFSKTPKMSTYLLAVLVGKFDMVETKTAEGIAVRVFTTPGKKHQADFALQTAAKILSFYTTYFGYEYPLPVMDLIAVPDFDAGAMENWGAVTFRETALLIDAQNSSASNKQRVALVIAHELAHMWFGNLVTMEWWTHLWLNEGFACYIEYLATNAIFPQWKIWDQFIVAEHNDALTLDSLKNTHPIEIEVRNPSEIVEIFDQVSYAKGASIIHMLATYVGADTFRNGLQVYLKKHAYQNATTEDLWVAFEEVSGKPIAKIMHLWTSKSGYPVIHVEEKDNTVEFVQERFFSSPLASKTEKDMTIWQVPLQIQTATTKENILLSKKNQSIKKPLGWMKVNAQESSFVRVAYTKELLNLLENPVKEKHVGTIDRLGIIRDAFDLAYAGDTKTTESLAFVTSFTQETEYVVWLEIAGQMQRLASLLASDKEAMTEFHKFGKALFAKIAGKKTWKKKSEDSQADILLRSIVLYQFGMYGDASTIQTAKKLFDLFIHRQEAIDPDIRGVVYLLVAENGAEKEFEIFKKLYKNQSLHQEKDRIARAMTSFHTPEIIEKVLEWILSEDVRIQDKTRYIYVLFTNPYARVKTWKFVKTHWEYFFKQFKGSHGMSRLVEGAGELTTKKDAKDIDIFFKKNVTPEVARTIEQVKENILTRALWLRRERASVRKFLKNH